MKDYVTHAYLCCNITAIHKQFMGMPGKSTPLTDSAHYIYDAILCS
jgi:hypothetical protein